MKIAVFADVHSNLDALEAVLDRIDRWRPDRVLVAGDIINRGPNPRACTERVLVRAEAEDWGVIRGNHERYVLKYVTDDLPGHGPEFEIIRHAKWTYEQLDGLVEPLAALPVQWDMTDDGGDEIRMVHASMLGDRKGIFPDDSEESLREKIAPPPAVLVVGHTHRPLIRTVDDTLVVNVGAVGAPFDRDPRAAYAQLTRADGVWQAEIIRMGYDREKAIADFHDSGYLEESGDFARLILAEFREARSLIPGWYRAYEDRVMRGEMTLKASVDLYLETCRIAG